MNAVAPQHLESLYTSESETITPMNHARVQESITLAVRRYLNAIGKPQSSDLYRLVIQEVEKPLLREVMQFCQHNQTQAAALLGLTRTKLNKKLQEHHIEYL